jgi:hypothetical protein
MALGGRAMTCLHIFLDAADVPHLLAGLNVACQGPGNDYDGGVARGPGADEFPRELDRLQSVKNRELARVERLRFRSCCSKEKGSG